LVRARDGRAVSSRVETDHGLFRVGRDVEQTGSADGEVVAEYMRGRRLDRSGASVGLQWRAHNEPASRDADPGPALPDLDAVGAREPRVIRLETFVGQPGGPTTGLAQVDSQDSPSDAFAR